MIHYHLLVSMKIVALPPRIPMRMQRQWHSHGYYWFQQWLMPRRSSSSSRLRQYSCVEFDHSVSNFLFVLLYQMEPSFVWCNQISSKRPELDSTMEWWVYSGGRRWRSIKDQRRSDVSCEFILILWMSGWMSERTSLMAAWAYVNTMFTVFEDEPHTVTHEPNQHKPHKQNAKCSKWTTMHAWP